MSIQDDIKAMRTKDWSHVSYKDMDLLKRVIDRLEKYEATLREILKQTPLQSIAHDQPPNSCYRQIAAKALEGE